MKDYLTRGLALNNNVRIFACDTTEMANEAQRRHDLWPTASAALGRTMSATAMIGGMNKNKEKVTITINGGGPIGTIMTQTKSDGVVRGFVGQPHTQYEYHDRKKLAVGIAVGNEGYLRVTRDMGLKEQFTGEVALQTGEIAEDFAYYFAASEQVPSVVSLGVLVNDDNTIIVSGGFIIQLLPSATEEDITYLESKMATFPPISSLLAEKKTMDEIIRMIFDDYVILDTSSLSFGCECSKEKMAGALMTLPNSDLSEMINEDHGCEITCQFCGEAYQFSEDELQNIIDSK